MADPSGSATYHGFRFRPVDFGGASVLSALEIWFNDPGNLSSVDTTPVLRLSNDGGTSPGLEVVKDGLTVTAGGLTVSTGNVTIPAGSIGAADIADNSLLGDQVANVANVNTEGGIPLVFRIDVAALGATVTSGATDVTVIDKIRVIDVHAIHTGGAGAAADNMIIHSSGGAITDGMSWSGADNTLIRATQLIDAQHEIIASGILRVVVDTSATDAASGAGTVYITAIKVA